MLNEAFVLRPTKIEVIDGDTIRVLALDLGLGFGKTTPTSIRLNGIDTPETGTHGTVKASAREKACGLKVKSAVEKWFAARPKAVLFSLSWEGDDEKYGRILGDFGLIAEGPSLVKYLLDNKLGRAYAGDKKLPWTDEQFKAIESFK